MQLKFWFRALTEKAHTHTHTRNAMRKVRRSRDVASFMNLKKCEQRAAKFRNKLNRSFEVSNENKLFKRSMSNKNKSCFVFVRPMMFRCGIVYASFPVQSQISDNATV